MSELNDATVSLAKMSQMLSELSDTIKDNSQYYSTEK